MHTLIVGATGGIGGAAARAFAARGDRLTLSGRDAGRLSALAAELGADSRTADLGYESHVRALLEETGEIDTLIYAAGAALPGPVQQADPAAVRAVWNANYFGALWVLKHGLGRLTPGGRVYLLGARPDLVTARGFSQYAASKAALSRAPRSRAWRCGISGSRWCCHRLWIPACGPRWAGCRAERSRRRWWLLLSSRTETAPRSGN